ncbi:NAD(P)-dependent dehydrogenase (short-subunit alcohol dehydrogenase family) [Sulfitobacter undariae]|uniref:NAD(P)-dependent dehydrogenase (Short-subunit alcohol dehydrogenase family) n=1 Tax=Sulfitobacter undariae TaxID=1563671 RepID=A0A7W6E756_9RHOB|nr:SDR family NAD(P)-dependent oxidoreductase [Sulfitobacter undariae]MBB3995980.1 NAD(P)-dependent dehydrogenase (short-subunit alcohol dehydrogenase family) [Sulfitobacter undariae]
MKRALIIGGFGGIGQALVQELKGQGCDVTTLSRSDDQLDITDENSIVQAMDRVIGPFDLIVVATGALEIGCNGPEKQLSSLCSDAMAAQFALNSMGPILILKHALKHISRTDRSVFAVLSARVGSIGDNRLGGWYSYRASKAALNQLIHTDSIEIARSHRNAICVILHPGTVATRFTEKFPNHAKVSAEEAALNLLMVMEELSPSQTGGFFDWKGNEVTW